MKLHNLTCSPGKAARRKILLQTPFPSCVHNTQMLVSNQHFLLLISLLLLPATSNVLWAQTPSWTVKQDHVIAEGVAQVTTKVYLESETVTVWYLIGTGKRNLFSCDTICMCLLSQKDGK